ncbi:hypothetical protein ABZ953_39155 [Streptomyces sp. NPDC046465]|uniref:hypothetical protein n=1 Tax=Streptomyces sp. NPDC046465 TaxID=3155810 RepID=UPI0033E8EF02
MWTFAAVGASAALLNLAPGPRSIGRWAAVGYRRLREHTVPRSMTTAPGATMTWALYPEHGTMQDPARRNAFHGAFARALTFVGGQARTSGIQIHVTHHAATVDSTTHTQTISVHVPKNVGSSDRILDTIEGEFATLGLLIPVDPDPIPVVTERGPGWVELEGGRYAATARITGWPAETDGDLMPRLLLGTPRDKDRDTAPERAMAVLYRPLTARQSRTSAKWADAASGAFTTDKIKAESQSLAGDTRREALVQGATLVDIDAYLTVWGDSPESVNAARRQTSLTADRYRIDLEWLAGQQHRAHVMTSPHGARTRKGAIL